MKHADHEFLFGNETNARLCGCGPGTTARLRLLADILRAIRDTKDAPSPDAVMSVIDKADRNVAGLLVMELLDMTEHGVSGNWSWLTPDGERMLRIIDDEKDDDVLACVAGELGDTDYDDADCESGKCYVLERYH